MLVSVLFFVVTETCILTVTCHFIGLFLMHEISLLEYGDYKIMTNL